MTNTHSRAKKGGELGANGEWYEGGKFIATTDHPKHHGSQKRGTGRREIEPGVWEVAPEEGMIALFPQLAGVEIFNRAALTFSFNPNLRNEFATAEAIASRKSKIERFNAGVRWI